MLECNICGNTRNNQTYDVREMMMGLREVFQYFQCGQCGCLQTRSIPENISDYYSNDHYYSMNQSRQNRMRSFLQGVRDHQYLFQTSNPFGKLLNWKAPVREELNVLRGMPKSNLLDIGCGDGFFLDRLARCGYRDLQGVDLFIQDDFTTEQGIPVVKGTVFDVVDRQFDFIRLSHSFEHMEKQQDVLQQIKKLLRKDGFCEISIPVIGYAWEQYQTDWVQLDAPRHYYIHTEKSMAMLAEKVGMRVKNIVYNSSEFQFVGSILYQRDIPLVEQTTERIIAEFGHEELKKFRADALLLNGKRQGDQAIFILC